MWIKVEIRSCIVILFFENSWRFQVGKVLVGIKEHGVVHIIPFILIDEKSITSSSP